MKEQPNKITTTTIPWISDKKSETKKQEVPKSFPEPEISLKFSNEESEEKDEIPATLPPKSIQPSHSLNLTLSSMYLRNTSD